MEEQIKRIESIELPIVELEGHRMALRQALIKKVIESNQRKANLWEKVNSHISDGAYGISQRLIPHNPIAKVTLISGFAIAMIFMILLLVVKPSFLVGPSDIVMTERIIQNSSQIRSALGGSDIALIKILGIKDHQADVVITGTSGNSVNANVDLKQGTVKVTLIGYVTIDQVINMIIVDSVTLLSNEDKESALDIAKTDPVSSTLFSEGALITGINPAHVYAMEITPNDSHKPGTITMTSREISFGEHTPIIVELTTAKGVQSILVDLNAGKVVIIIPGTVTFEPPSVKP